MISYTDSPGANSVGISPSPRAEVPLSCDKELPGAMTEGECGIAMSGLGVAFFKASATWKTDFFLHRGFSFALSLHLYGYNS